MEFDLTAEESLVRSAARDFLASRADLRRARTVLEGLDDSEDAKLWLEMAERADLNGIVIPADLGGGGGTLVHLALVFEEMGRVLLRSPYYASVGLAGQTLLAVGDDRARSSLLPRIASGRLRATAYFGESRRHFDPASIRVRAVGAGDAWKLQGECRFVPDGDRADVVLVVAHAGDGIGVFAVDAASSGVTRTGVPTIDPTRPLGHLSLAGVAAVRASSHECASGLERAFALAQVVSAAEHLGAAEACLEMSVEHAKTRTQFGRPIATFQAVKQKCAEMLLTIEAARMSVYFAGWAAAGAPDELAAAARDAHAMAVTALSSCARTNIQIHGGIGYTWEHDAHLFFRRARAATNTL